MSKSKCKVCPANSYCPKDVEENSHTCAIFRVQEEGGKECPVCGDKMTKGVIPPGFKIIKAKSRQIKRLKELLSLAVHVEAYKKDPMLVTRIKAELKME